MISKSPITVTQMTDTHLFTDLTLGKTYGVSSQTSFLKLLEKLGRLQPQLDALLLTRGVVKDESLGAYQCLVSLISPLNIPNY
ncbi:MAG: hypothetical protein O4806_04295 [Trichodesmium sp. St5_bin8]|nr:hypothetical protein [Trichodesmium sp. St5_bin8]